MENIENIENINIQLSEPDEHGERHADIDMLLDFSKREKYIMMSINGNEPKKFHVSYQIFSKTSMIINGVFTNVEAYTTRLHNRLPNEVTMLFMIGRVEQNGISICHLFTKSKL